MQTFEEGMKKQTDDFFAEIIESHLDHFTAQTWDAEISPTFGSLVETKDRTKSIYGIVTSIETASMDPMHYPFTYKKTEEELKREQPQIYQFLKTTFNVQVVGFSKPGTTTETKNNSTIRYQMISVPPKIHSFVKKSSVIGHS